MLPLAALVYMLFEGFTPLYAGSMGLALTVALILGASITLGFSNTALRYIFWIGLALVVAAVSRNGLEIVPVAGVVGRLILIASITRGGRATLAACRDSLADSAKSALTVGMACAIVGTIIGMMTQTGVGTIFGSWIIGLGGKSLFLALIMTMLLSILLGTGIPDHPDLHHHRGAGSACAGEARRAADRQPHVRVLLRHHGRPLAAGGAGRAWRRRRSPRKIPTRSAGRRCASRSPATSFPSSSSIRRR